MFIGEYRHTFDTKNRVSLPAKFRSLLGKSVVITRGIDSCLFVYPKQAWKEEAKRFAGQSMASRAGRGLARLMLAGATEVDVDTSGRVLVPDYLKEYAKLNIKTVVAGVSDRVEI